MSNLIGGGSAALALLQRIEELENRIKQLEENNKDIIAQIGRKVRWITQNGLEDPRISLYKSTTSDNYYLQLYFAVNGTVKFINLGDFKLS